jgi:hypothetical protein
MTSFEDELLNDLLTEHGARLRELPPPGRARRRVLRRPGWLAAGGVVALGAAVTAVVTAVTALGGAAPAYAVTRGPGGSVEVSVSQPSGVAGANAALGRMHVRVRVVPVRAGCRSITSLPHPRAWRHRGGIQVGTGIEHHGHRYVRVRAWGNAVPRGATMLLAFTTRGGANLGVGGVITGRVPRCVSIPAGLAPPGGAGGPA